MLLAMVLFGAALAFLGTNLPKTLGLWFPPERLGLANGVSLAGLGVGVALATLLTPRVVGAVGGWRRLTLVLGLVTLALAVYWFLAVREHTTSQGSRPSVERFSNSVADLWRVKQLWLGAYLSVFLSGRNPLRLPQLVPCNELCNTLR